MKLKNYNPDVLSCLANLSNDEVFTPPQLANQILDMLPPELLQNPQTTFLDPCCKSGVFLREIAKRLIKGLETQIPDLQTRLNHIYTKQLFGVAITELTALLARRSVYCSRKADGKYSVCTDFRDESGNIRFKPVKHEWENGKCKYCGASQAEYDRGDELESHAYEFIHNPKELLKMKFDVIIGNPPYQMSLSNENQKDDSLAKAGALPIYQKFIEQALKLQPRYLTMIIPSRWFSGGRGLDEFRRKMLNDSHISVLHDFFDASDCFPGIDLSGGACYFLWERDKVGKCRFVSHSKEKNTTSERYLNEFGDDKFVRFNEAVPILKKIFAHNEKMLDEYVSSQNPYGLNTNFRDFSDKETENTVFVYAYPKNGFVNKSFLKNSLDTVDKWKVFTAKAYGERGSFPYLVLGKPFIGEPNTASTATYRILHTFQNKECALNFISYIKTRFFRFLVLLLKNTQDAPKRVYQFVPLQDFNEPWTDEKLYKKYGLTQEETDFIESMIRPME